MWGASSPHVKLTGDPANVSEAIRIGDCSRFVISRKIRRPATFDFCNSITPKATKLLHCGNRRLEPKGTVSSCNKSLKQNPKIA
jgi:hypothetical protein